MLKKAIVVFALTLLSGCSSNSVINSLPGSNAASDINFDDMYLRGVFNWWEATPAYRLNEGRTNWYVDVELIADGQPYDFKLADKLWTASQTCGGKYKGQPATLNQTTYLVCGSDAENIQFVPSTTDTYRFSFARASGDEIRLDITPAPAT